MLPVPVSPDDVQNEVAVIPMDFRVEFRPIPGKDGEFKEVHAVDLVKKGTNGMSTPYTIKALQNGNPDVWRVVKQYYDRWLEGQEDPAEGTPIDVLPFLPKALVGHLRNLNIRSAEDLAACTDSDIERIGMGGRGYRDKTKMYLENRGEDMKLAAALADRDAELAQARAEIAELREMVNGLVDEDKPKRGGRPKKDAAA